MPEGPWKTRTGTVELLPTGVTVLRLLPHEAQTLDDARENVASAVKIGMPWMRPLLLDLRHAPPLEADVRRFYGGAVSGVSFLALGLLVEESPVGRMTGGLYLPRAEEAGVPARCSSDEAEALRWLEELTGERRAP
jgi:hypothetical protein